MRISRQIETVPEDYREGSLWDKWKVDGRTTWEADLSAAHIVTFRAAFHGPTEQIFAAAMNHEHGHAQTIQNRVESDVMDDPSTYDRWAVEVEAWIRGMEESGFLLTQGQLALDCLNSYRRSLGVSDGDWDAARRIIVDMAVDNGTGAALALYVPTEPDPDDSPPDCGGEGMGQPAQPQQDTDGDEDTDDDGDTDQDGEEEDGDEDGEDGDEDRDGDTDTDRDNLKKTYDEGWMRQEVLDALEDGIGIVEAALRYGVDPTRVPPLARAFDITT